jgi:hypothetical protein
VARLRAEGRILEIGPGDLSLTQDEASLLLRNADIAVGEQDVTELHRRTEGWPAGLYLAALYLREGGPLPSSGGASSTTSPRRSSAHQFWAVAKSIDGFTSWGPWIRRDLTERALEGSAITGTVNGGGQSGNTKYFAFTPSEMISHVSQLISLFPGDVIALGTPPPPPEVAVGDHVVCDVEEVGVLNNYVVADSAEPPSHACPRHVGGGSQLTRRSDRRRS